MKKKCLFLLLIIILACSSTNNPVVKIEINDKIYTFEVASTSEARKLGLMYRKKLNKDKGMLFVYNNKNILNFYMKNTLIPLDIAYIDDNRKITEIREMQPLDETTITSQNEVQYALEVNRGFFKRVGLKVGDKLNFVTPVPYID